MLNKRQGRYCRKICTSFTTAIAKGLVVLLLPLLLFPLTLFYAWQLAKTGTAGCVSGFGSCLGLWFVLLPLFTAVYYLGFASAFVFQNYYNEMENVSFLEAWIPFIMTVIVAFQYLKSAELGSFLDQLKRKFDEFMTSQDDFTFSATELLPSKLATMTLEVQRFGSNELETMSVEDVMREIQPNTEGRQSILMFFAEYFIPILVALVHCAIPGVYRVIAGNGFFGDNKYERIVAVLHIGCSFPYVYALGKKFSELIFKYSDHTEAFQNVAILTSPKDATARGLELTVDLAEDDNLIGWMFLRQGVRESRLKLTETAFFVVSPVCLLVLGLIATIIIRVIILSSSLDLFIFLGTFDVIVLSSYLLVLLFLLVDVNQSITVRHVEALQQRQFTLAEDIVDDVSVRDRDERYYRLQILEKMETRIKERSADMQFQY